MSDGGSFRSAPRTTGPSGSRVAVLVVVLAVAFVGLAIAKPWSSSGGPTAPTPGPSSIGLAGTPGSPAPTVTQAPREAPPTQVEPGPGPLTMHVPPSAMAIWTGLRWHRLAPGDPLGLVRSVLRWRGGFIAVGWDFSGGDAMTPMWASRDGSHWELLSPNTSSTFWPGMRVVGIAEVPTGLVAFTELTALNDGCGLPACQLYTPPVVPWTSPDGRTWTPHGPPELRQADAAPAPLLAAGPTGLVAMTTGPAPHVATSADGIRWQTLPTKALPTGFRLYGLVGTTRGFTAVGTLTVSESDVRAVAIRSTNGTTWSGPIPLHLVSASGVILASTDQSWGATGLVAARRGFIAIGSVFATPGGALWWQSANGRDWRALLTYPPLGPTTCTGEGCGMQPNGLLVGDGERMIALRGSPDSGAWTSFDGLTWRRLRVIGDLPSEQATNAVLLPGGVLLSDPTSTWFGEAITR